MPNKRFILTLVAALLVAVGSSVRVPAYAGPSSDTLVALSEDEIAGLLFMREEEKLARDSYIVLGDLWGVPVFANIAESEQSHTDAVEKILIDYQIPDPVSDESDVGTFVDPELQTLYDDLMADGEDSEMAALYVGAAIEETDMEDILAWIELTSHEDITSVYESLLCGSRNHLRAFVQQIENRGVVYVAQVLTQEEVDAIVDSATERDCGGSREDDRNLWGASR